MASYQIERFEFLPGCIVFEGDDRTKWSVRLPAQQGLDAGLRALRTISANCGGA